MSSKRQLLKTIKVRIKLSFYTLFYGLKGTMRVLANEIRSMKLSNEEKLHMVYFFTAVMEAQLLKDVFKMDDEQLRRMLEEYSKELREKRAYGVM